MTLAHCDSHRGMTLAPGDIQGNIVQGYKHLHFAAYVFCEIDDSELERVRKLILELLDPRLRGDTQRFSVMTGAPWEKAKVREALNVALTFRGLEKLGWGRCFAQFPDFAEGMYARAEQYLHDSGESAPERWQQGLRAEADILFVLYSITAENRDRRVEDLEAQLALGGLKVTGCQRAGRISGSADDFGPREHFGFRDGLSQPALADPGGAAAGEHRAVQDKPEHRVRGEGVLKRPWLLGSRWRPVEIGEFLLGYRDEDGVIAGSTVAPNLRLAPESPLRNGTFMVWRKLRQDVGAFEAFVVKAADVDLARETDALTADSPAAQALKAKLVGRWPDGTSILRAPFTQASPGGRGPSNYFDYATDPHGARCPLGAHVRRANPRASLKWGTERARRHRIIRRGLPYDEGDGEVGLIFVCFNASINRQFEQIQGNWLMDGDAFGLGGEQDFVLGEGGEQSSVTIQGDRNNPARFLQGPPTPLVRTLGGYYLFVPGVAALARIAAGSEPKPRLPDYVIAWGLARYLYRLIGRLQERGDVHHKPHPKLLRQLARSARQRPHAWRVWRLRARQ